MSGGGLVSDRQTSCSHVTHREKCVAEEMIFSEENMCFQDGPAATATGIFNNHPRAHVLFTQTTGGGDEICYLLDEFHLLQGIAQISQNRVN